MKLEIGMKVFYASSDERMSSKNGEKTITKITSKYFYLDEKVKCMPTNLDRNDNVIGIEQVSAGANGYIYLSEDNYKLTKDWNSFTSNIRYAQLNNETKKKMLDLYKNAVKN